MIAEDFREPWIAVNGEVARRFEQEAAKEIARGHELHGRALQAFAKCAGCDDVAFRVDDGSFAIVHLTWTTGPDSPPWPTTTRLGGFIAIEDAMDQHDH